MMKIKFANGVVKDCALPTEQKLFKNVSDKLIGVGWVLHLKLMGLITSTELDELLNEDNIKTLEFSYETENGETVKLFNLDGYEKVTSSVIRYAEDANTSYAEFQLSKGV